MATPKSPRITESTARTVPDARNRAAAMERALAYRGNVPLRGFAGWLALVLFGALAVGLALAQLLVMQRQTQLIDETSSRVALQGQARAGLVGEWLQGIEKVSDALAGAQLTRLYVAEVGLPKDPGSAQGSDTLPGALKAQTPYMQQALHDFMAKNGAEGAHLVAANGQVVVGAGVAPEGIAANPQALRDVVGGAKGVILPLRLGKNEVVMDMLRPIFQPSQEGTDTPVVGALWLTIPVGDKLAELVKPTPLDRSGERTALLQDDAGKAVVVGKTALMPVARSVADLKDEARSGRAMTLSVVDGLKTFAALMPVAGSPFTILQEYQARKALGLMNIYKPGLYTIVALATGILAALMLALTLHLMAQRNTSRVKLLGQTMDALVRMVEARDPFLAGHHARLARIVIQLSNGMGLPVGERATLYYAAQMSAVGRLLVPRDLLAKKGKLTPAERKELEGHVARAQDILGDIDFDLPVVPVIQQMYEREDGSGYPHGLHGNEIHRMAKVLGAADAYCALTSRRAHRDAMTPEEALKTMAGTHQFEKGVVSALKKLG